MCNYLNNYTNLNDAHHIWYTSLWKMYKKCIPYLSGIFSKLCSNKKKSHYGFKKVFFLNLMPKRGEKLFAPLTLNFQKVGWAIAPSSFAQHLSSCQSRMLVVCASQSSVFWVFVIFCQPLNICLFVMLYLYMYIIYCY